MKRRAPFDLTLAALLVFAAPACYAQFGPEKGAQELQVWTGGGHAINGITYRTAVWNVGLRYGRVLTEEHGSGVLRGRLEYAADLVPVFRVNQPGGNASGLGVNPFALKWNFAAARRVVPYIEAGGGVLFTNRQVPPGGSRVNFTSGGALGVHLFQGHFGLSTEIRFLHISNAGISSWNPGINTLQLRVGFGVFTQPRAN